MLRRSWSDAQKGVREDARKKARAQPNNRNQMQVRSSRLLELPHHGLIRVSAARAANGFLSASPAEISYAVITDRPARLRIADELGWAAKYRKDAKSSYLPGNRALAVRAARACIDAARELQRERTPLPA